MNINPQRAQALLLAALELSDPAARRELLDRECAGDAALRQRVEDLLVTGGIGEEPSGQPDAATVELPAVNRRGGARAEPDFRSPPPWHSVDRPGTVLAGRYKLLEAIGEGGMGTVWVAEQSQPVKRKVAIKLVKAGMDSRHVLARFEAERQALAMMDHPNIAKVLDGGLTDQGRPFFVMEYVKGVPLNKYCDQARLSLKERLNLFIPVCHAVQHAHQKGIIHRDLKPSNILICLYDGKPVPKVIDFGLAKAMHHSLTDHTLHTAHGMMVGTPLYMSPEQAEHNNLDVDTRTDIYSLGVILYELLTGTTPLETQQLTKAAHNEVLRLIKEVEPPKPSTRLSGSENLPIIAAQRSIEPRQLRKSVVGDLDWIVMKALDKERSRRYETANGLARDVERYLHEEPVEACPPSTVYRFHKFVHKHRAAFFTAAAFVLLLLLGTALSAWQAIRAEAATTAEKAQRKRAERAELEARGNEAKAKEREAAEALARQAERQQKELARAARIQAEDRLVRHYVANGQRFANDGDLFTSLIWFAQALKLESNLADRDFVHRLRLGSFLRSCPTLSLSWSFERPVTRAKFSSNGKLVGTISGTYARVWDATTGEPVSPKFEHKAFYIQHLAFSPDGRLLAVAGDIFAEDRDVRIWRVDNGELANDPIQIKGDVRHMMFSPDSRHLLVATGPDRNGTGESVVNIIEIATGRIHLSPIKERGPLTCVKYSPNGETIVIVRQRFPAQVSLWNAMTGKLRQRPVILGTRVADANFAAVSPSGLSFVTAGSVNTKHPRNVGYHPIGIARVWDCSTNKPVTLQLPHRKSVTFAAFSPNDRYVATATGEDTDGIGVYEAWVWDARTGLPVVPPLLHSAAVSVVQFSPNGEALLTGSSDGTVRIWDVSTGEPLTPPLHGKHVVSDASFSPDGTRVLMACGDKYGLNGGEVRIWDWNGAPKPQLFEAPASEVRFTPDGSRAVSFPGTTVYGDAKSNRAHLITLGDGATTIPVLHNGHAYYASFSSDNRLLATGTGSTPRYTGIASEQHELSGEAQIWNAETAEPVGAPMTHPLPVVFTEFSPNGDLLFTVATPSDRGPFDQPSFWLWDVVSQKPVISEKTMGDGITDARFSPDGKRIVIAGFGAFHVVDVETREVTSAKAEFRGGGASGSMIGPKRRIAFAPDGWRVILSSGGDEAIFLDLHSMEEVGPLITGRGIDHVAFSSDGKTALTAGDKEVRLWNAETGEAATPPLSHEALVEYADFALNGRIVVTASRDHTVCVWDSRTGEKLTTPFVHSSFVQQTRVSANGNRLLSQVHSHIYSWDLSPITWPQEDLVTWVELVGCRRINSQGHLVASNMEREAELDPRTITGTDGTNATWKWFQERYPVLFKRLEVPQPRPGEVGAPDEEASISEETATRLELKGREALDRGQAPEALRVFRSLNAVCVQLVQSNPENRGLKRRLWFSYYWMGKANILLNDEAQAERSLVKAAELCTELIESDSGDRQARADLAYPFWGMSELKGSIGDLNAAREQLQVLLKTLEPLLGLLDTEGKVHQAYVSTLSLLRDVCIQQGDMEGAQAVTLQTLQVQERRAKEDLTDYATRLTLANGHLELAREALNLAKSEDATLQGHEAVQWLDQCRALGIQDESNADRLSTTFREVGVMAIELKDDALASNAFEKGLEVVKATLEKRPSPDGEYNLACLYSLRASVPSEREIEQLAALAIAELQKAVDLGYRDWRHMERDEDLDAIRTQSGYKELVEKLKGIDGSNR